uniref:Uncharacterized protein n=1 Tax=Caenorhabditis japonica TaxID=281687 RepID=A0A8R1HLV0_CAEJA
MIQYIILGYLIYEIIHLSQLPDVSAVKFKPPPDEQPSATPPSSASSPGPSPAPDTAKSETATAQSK